MVFLHQWSLYLHITVGAVALLLFWVPMFARKGSFDHKRFGRYFAIAMYTVSISGLVMASTDLMLPLSYHLDGVEVSAEDAARFTQTVRNSALFLLSLSILVLASTRHGWLVINGKENRESLRTRTHLSLLVGLLVIGVVLFANGLQVRSPLFMIFGGLETVVGINMLRYSLKSSLRPREWWTEHLGALIGAGIGAYTAFFVFGGSRLLSSLVSGPLSGIMIVFWVAPGVIGGIASYWLTRHYRRKFEKPTRQEAAGAPVVQVSP